VERLPLAPAAKHYHRHTPRSLEHCLSVAQAVSATSATFEVSTATSRSRARWLHDIASSRPTPRSRAIDLTDAGACRRDRARYYRVRRTIEEIEGFPAELAQAVTHIILSHHGTLEHGSPVVPCTREATLVHMIDNLGGRLGKLRPSRKELAPGLRWSGYDRRCKAARSSRTRRRSTFRPSRTDRPLEKPQIAIRAAPRVSLPTVEFYGSTDAKDREADPPAVVDLLSDGRASPVTALEIRRDVEGYSGMNEDAFARRFYADRSELESLRIQLTGATDRRGGRAGELLAAARELPSAAAIAFFPIRARGAADGR